VHFDANGVANGFAGKEQALLMLPAMAAGVIALFGAIPYIEPRRFNLAASAKFYKVGWIGVTAILALAHTTIVLAALHVSVDIPHTVLPAVLTETGLVGLSLFLAIVFLWARDAWRLWLSDTQPLETRQQGLLMLAVIGVYFVNGMFHNVSAAPMANMILFFAAGMTAGLRPRIRSAFAPSAAKSFDAIETGSPFEYSLRRR